MSYFTVAVTAVTGYHLAPCLRGSCGIIKRRSCSCRSGQVLRQGGLPAPCKDSAICAFRLVIFITSRDPNWVAAVAPWVTTPAQPLHLRRGGQVPARSNLTAGRGA